MTDDLKKYIESLDIQLLKMVDGSLILLQIQHRDEVDRYIVVQRPLQVAQIFVENSIKTIYIPWIPGSQEHIRLNLDNVIVEADADFSQKFAYSRYYLIQHLKNNLTSEEFNEIMHDYVDNDISDNHEYDLPAGSSKLKHALQKQKRFNLN